MTLGARAYAGIMLAAAAVAAVSSSARAQTTPPNFLIILTDDQGWGDNSYNCENSTGMCAHTPNLDALAKSPHTALFHRFYSAAGVCSPTRASLLTGRTNERSCIHFALTCDQENPATTCAMGSGLPHSEFTIADAVAKSPHNYASIMLGKWHLGDLFAKPNVRGYTITTNPGSVGFDDWMMTEAEASSSMSNCGCFPVNHTTPGPKPPSGYDKITPHGDHCVVGGGFESDWCYPCTNYFFPANSSVQPSGAPTPDPAVSTLTEKVPGDDSEFIVDHFEKFLNAQIAAKRPFLAHLCTHSIHEPHPSMPEYWALYERDPDYLGTLTQLDVQFGRIMQLLQSTGVYENTIIFYTTDNGPHQGEERTDIHWSTNFLRQCKASIFEGGIRVPGMMHAPALISTNLNVSTPATTADFLPTIMDIIGVESSHPSWAMDGISLLPLLKNITAPRPKPLVFSWGGLNGVIDNEWKIINKVDAGQCDFQEPYASNKTRDDFYLFNLATDYHELVNLKYSEPEQFTRMMGLYNAMLASIANSQANETGCGGGGPPPPPAPPAPPSDDCTWVENSGLFGADMMSHPASTREECCGLCKATSGCVAADLNGNTCHLKPSFQKIARQGSTACVPNKTAESRNLHA